MKRKQTIRILREEDEFYEWQAINGSDIHLNNRLDLFVQIFLFSFLFFLSFFLNLHLMQTVIKLYKLHNSFIVFIFALLFCLLPKTTLIQSWPKEDHQQYILLFLSIVFIFLSIYSTFFALKSTKNIHSDCFFFCFVLFAMKMPRDMDLL